VATTTSVASTPVDVITNPGNASQLYILWGNGRIDNVGGAVAATCGTTFFTDPKQPVLVAIWITNWASGQGYALHRNGRFISINGATEISTLTGTVWSNSNGLAYNAGGYLYVDWSWDPAGSGQGYALTQLGELRPFGGATAPPRTGTRFASPAARELQMQWTPSKAAITLDLHGSLYADFGANVTGANAPRWAGWDAARDFVVTDWISVPNKGYILDLYGGITPFGGNGAVYNNPYQAGGDHYRTLNVISASNPLELFVVGTNGQQSDFISSTAPTVICGNGVSEVQTVTITGSPTGGTFTLTFNGQTARPSPSTRPRARCRPTSPACRPSGPPASRSPVAPVRARLGGHVRRHPGHHQRPPDDGLVVTHRRVSPTVAVSVTTDGVTASPANTVTTTTRPGSDVGLQRPQKDAQAQWEVYLFTTAFVAAHPTLSANPALFATWRWPTAPTPRPTSAASWPTWTWPTAGLHLLRPGQGHLRGQWSAWASRAWTQNVTLPSERRPP
jgi:hypothetical protein